MLDLQHRALPFVHLAGMVRCRARIGAFPRRPDALRAIHQVVDQAAMPGLPSLQRDVEAQPPVGIYRRLAVSLAGADDHFATKIPVAIGDAQHLPLVRPRCGDAAAPHDVIALDLEDVGEIGADRDLQVETHRLLAVVGDVNVLVQSATRYGGRSPGPACALRSARPRSRRRDWSGRCAPHEGR